MASSTDTPASSSGDLLVTLENARRDMATQFVVEEPTVIENPRLRFIRHIATMNNKPSWFTKDQDRWGLFRLSVATWKVGGMVSLQQNFVKIKGQNIAFGRFYANPKNRSQGTEAGVSKKKPFIGSLTFAPKSLLSALLGPEYFEIDVQNCHYAIAEQLGRAFGVSVPLISAYCENREHFLTEISIAYGCTRDVAKNAMIRVLFGGAVAVWVADNNLEPVTPCNHLHGITKEIARLSNTIHKHPGTLGVTYRAITASKNRNGQKVSEGPKAMSLLFQDLEALIVSALRASFRRPISVYKFDGVVVKGSVSPSDLAQIARGVEARTGFKVTFTVKELAVGANPELGTSIQSFLAKDVVAPPPETAPSPMDNTRDPFCQELEGDTAWMDEMRAARVPEFALWKTYCWYTLFVHFAVTSDFGNCEIPYEDMLQELFQMASRCVVRFTNGTVYVRMHPGMYTTMKEADFIKMCGHRYLNGRFLASNDGGEDSSDEEKGRKIMLSDICSSKMDHITRGEYFSGAAFHPYPPTTAIHVLPNRILNIFLPMCAKLMGTETLAEIRVHIRRSLYHLFAVICCGEQKSFNYLMTYLYTMIFEPRTKYGTCPILTGPHGGGKSVVARMIARMLGKHLCTSFPTVESLTAKFAVTAGYLFAVVEEGESCKKSSHTNSANLSMLKTRITEEEVRQEEKYQQARVLEDHTHYLIITNSTAQEVTNSETGERRFGVLNISGVQRSKKEYFDPLYVEMATDVFPDAMITFLYLTVTKPDFVDEEFSFTYVNLRDTNVLPGATEIETELAASSVDLERFLEIIQDRNVSWFELDATRQQVHAAVRHSSPGWTHRQGRGEDCYVIPASEACTVYNLWARHVNPAALSRTSQAIVTSWRKIHPCPFFNNQTVVNGKRCRVVILPRLDPPPVHVVNEDEVLPGDPDYVDLEEMEPKVEGTKDSGEETPVNAEQEDSFGGDFVPLDAQNARIPPQFVPPGFTFVPRVSGCYVSNCPETPATLLMIPGTGVRHLCTAHASDRVAQGDQIAVQHGCPECAVGFLFHEGVRRVTQEATGDVFHMCRPHYEALQLENKIKAVGTNHTTTVHMSYVPGVAEKIAEGESFIREVLDDLVTSAMDKSDRANNVPKRKKKDA